MKLRYRPPSLQKGFRAFTTPAPLGPSRAHAAGQRDNGDAALGKGIQAGGAMTIIDVIRPRHPQ